MLPEKIKLLDVVIGLKGAGQLLHQSRFEFRYLDPNPKQPAVGLLMPPSKLTYEDSALFPVMDQNLPEGDLFMRLRQMFPKQPLTAMHLLALAGANGIGRLGFSMPGIAPAPQAPVISRAQLLSTAFTPEVFDDLVHAYLSTGAGVAGMQPKIMVPVRATIPIPTVIVKAASAAYPGLAANEFFCLKAAKAAGILTPGFDLSDDGQMLLVDRFDIDANGERIGFEDVASLMGLRVRDTLSDRKYHGSYERIAEALKMLRLPDTDLHRFFEQVAFTVMVSNGDGHLKNFGVLYGDAHGVRLAPMFDVVTTRIYRYARLQGGADLEDQTLALKLFVGKGQTRTYPTTEELLRFGREVCRVTVPQSVLARIAQAMSDTLAQARQDTRIPPTTLRDMATLWDSGMAYARA
ncbi:MAG: type II toxin-antitoxin system HipA family toxin [Rhodoferax sp.]|uniref:type II toxin-antitoxin system HipA family toxin n=1 Tax=Rhodoferax sp. TaxID=50421 RepID=UPI002731A1A1|nr:type II toxin-antitoxin system HipA family toxin [Rhodoferax sp.]MDP1528042.1 type II toxin-antitoxin system HipA family toxin [Rhodoferax sp.]MDP1944043.1 type II toxin-antitoxin system HipA family toxin [Rhodoferax sp.]